MENTYLQQVLRVLTKSEWKVLGDFVASPYFNKNEKFVRFYDKLSAFYPDFDVNEKEKVKLFLNTLQVKTFNDAGYRNLCSDFLVLVQEFIAQEALNTGYTVKEHLLNRTLILRNVLDLAEKNLKKVEVLVSKSEYDFQEKLMAAIWINDLKILHHIYANRKSINASNVIMSEDNTHKFITEWALLRIFTALLNQIKGVRNLNRNIDIKKYDAYLNLYDFFQPFDFKETKIIYLTLKMNIYDDENIYYECIEIVKTLDFTKNIKTNENLIIGLLDYVDYKVSTNERWRNEIFELYEIKLGNRLWSQQKMLSYSSLFNAIHNSLQLNKIDKAEIFLETYIKEVSPHIQSTLFHLCSAWIAFFKDDYEKAHEHLVKVETENMMVKYEMRSLQCLIYLQKKDWDLLTAALESFRQFIAYNKNNIGTQVTQQFSLVCKYIGLTAKLFPDYHPKEKEKIIQQMTDENNSYMRNWLINKINSGK
jgi:hypothetical protein